MIEMSAPVSSSRTLHGGALAVAVSPVPAEATGKRDFSALLAGAAQLATPTEKSEPAAPPVPDPAIIQAAAAGKTGNAGRQTGKMLPSGKAVLDGAADGAEDRKAADQDDVDGSQGALSAEPLAALLFPAPTAIVLPLSTSPVTVRLTGDMLPQGAQPKASDPAAMLIASGSAMAPANDQAVEALPGSLLASAALAAPVDQVIASSTGAAPTSLLSQEMLDLRAPLLRQDAVPVASRLAVQAGHAAAANDFSATAAPSRDAAAAPVIAQATDHKAARPAPVPALDTVVPALVPEAAPVAAAPDLRAPLTSTFSPAAPATPTQDVAALVDRIAEARAAAAPTTVRAALVHEDFGSVSLRFRAEDAHIHVTLGNADPGFAPAVQAAAAASLGKDADDQRRDAQAQQQAHRAQDDAPRNDASSHQQASHDRAAGGERHALREQRPGRSLQSPVPTGRDPSDSASQPRSGIYA